ncbi:hypothetical protein Dimus_022710 [Dionaea muscipula]
MGNNTQHDNAHICHSQGEGESTPSTNPNSWMIITSYIFRCKRAGVKPSFLVFYKLFKLIDNQDEHQISTGYFCFALWKPGYAVVEMKNNVKFWKVPWEAVTDVEEVVEQEVVEAQNETEDAVPSVNNMVIVEESTMNVEAEVINLEENEEKEDKEVEVEDRQGDVLSIGAETQSIGSAILVRLLPLPDREDDRELQALLAAAAARSR